MMASSSLPLTPLRKGPLTSAHLVRWCAAQQNWHKIHFDQAYSQQRAGLPERVVNGALKQHLLVQFLENAFEGGWICQLDFRFAGPDLVDQTLEVRGEVVERTRSPGGGELARVAVEIYNIERSAVTTTGAALVHLAPSKGKRIAAAPGLFADLERLDTPGEGANLAQRFGLALGNTLERLQSDYPIDLSRLRLFADAVGDLAPCYFDAEAASSLGFPAVLATPLFPVHGLELRPGSRPLSHDQGSWGREGASEVGRSAGDLLGLPGEKMVNGGSVVRVHSLAMAGDTVVAESRLLALVSRPEARSGPLLSLQTLNSYTTVTGRLLLEERVSILYRGVTL